jgi:hypothetical protein
MSQSRWRDPLARHAYDKVSYAVQSPYQMGTFAPRPYSLSQLVDSRKSSRVAQPLCFRTLHVFYFPPQGLLDRRHRENKNKNNKSRVQTCPNLGHFSKEQMCPFGTGTELRSA